MSDDKGANTAADQEASGGNYRPSEGDSTEGKVE